MVSASGPDVGRDAGRALSSYDLLGGRSFSSAFLRICWVCLFSIRASGTPRLASFCGNAFLGDRGARPSLARVILE